MNDIVLKHENSCEFSKIFYQNKVFHSFIPEETALFSKKLIMKRIEKENEFCILLMRSNPFIIQNNQEDNNSFPEENETEMTILSEKSPEKLLIEDLLLKINKKMLEIIALKSIFLNKEIINEIQAFFPIIKHLNSDKPLICLLAYGNNAISSKKTLILTNF